VNDTGFIFLLVLGVSLLSGIVAFAHISANQLSKRIAERRAKAAEDEPELDFSNSASGYAARPGARIRSLAVHVDLRQHA
jgi:Tfp pilus assembly protein PilX